MTPPRPYWKGYIKLAPVSCPIALYTASAKELAKKPAASPGRRKAG